LDGVASSVAHRAYHHSQQWYFGMKGHLGVDTKSKVIHTVVATAANVHDATVLPDLLHGEETRVWGEQAAIRPNPGPSVY
jgi:IS5 family transposase